MSINFRNARHYDTVVSPEKCPQDGLPEIVFSGKSNVGKSSMINLLCGKKGLARVSQAPGKTRQLIYFKIDEQLYFTDLPGYGYAKISFQQKKQFNQIVESYFNTKRPIQLILHLIDIRHKPGENDLKMLEWLGANSIPWQIMLTKADKLSRQQMHKQKQLMMKTLNLPADKFICFSAHNREGLQETRQLIASHLGAVALMVD